MISKWSQEERRRRRTELKAQPYPDDLEILELMGLLRPLCGGCDYMDNPRVVALHELWKAIENAATVLTGEPRYYWTERNAAK